jgi:hypothetical protein
VPTSSELGEIASGMDRPRNVTMQSFVVLSGALPGVILTFYFLLIGNAGSLAWSSVSYEATRSNVH